jgi:acyl-CoA thioesterase I
VRRSLFLLGCIICMAWPAAANSAKIDRAPVILVYGNSLSAGYGIRVERGWVALLQMRLRREGYGQRVINASVSGETTAGGLARLPRALKVHRPTVVILELGGNDGLRALALAETRNNFSAMLDLIAEARAQTVLLGMRLPPNYGPAYTTRFQALYSDLAKSRRLALVPFFLDGVALNPQWMQADGIHPNEAGQATLLNNLWPTLTRVLKK